MLAALPVARRYRLNRRDKVAVRIKAGMILSTLEVRAGDAVRVLWNSRTDGNRSWASVLWPCEQLNAQAASGQETRAPTLSLQNSRVAPMKSL